MCGARCGSTAYAVEELTADEIRRRFPAFRFPDDYVGVFEQAAGFLYVEECVRAHIDAAVSLGAEIHAEEPVREWKAVGDGVEVTTDQRDVPRREAGRHRRGVGDEAARRPRRAARGDAAGDTVVRRGRAAPPSSAATTFPIFIADVPGGPFYGLPGDRPVRAEGRPPLRGTGTAEPRTA